MLDEINRDLVEALGAAARSVGQSSATSAMALSFGRARSSGLLVGGFGRALHRVWTR